MPLIGLTPDDVCVCFNLSLSITVVSPDAHRHSSSWNRLIRAAGGGGSCCPAGDGGSSPGGDAASLSPRFGAGVQPPSPGPCMSKSQACRRTIMRNDLGADFPGDAAILFAQ
eukprot:SAG25_NODE_9107_length_387_cov_1.222222_1_plen_111_part_01